MNSHTIELTQKQVDVLYAALCCHKEGQQDLLEALNEVSRALWSLTSVSGMRYTTDRINESSKITFNETPYPPLAWQNRELED